MDNAEIGSNNGLDKITPALVKFHSEVGSIKKNSENPFFKSSYASLPDILSVVSPTLVKCDLAIVQVPIGENELETRLIHISGQSIGGRLKFQPKDTSPQSLGSAITYARRYALGAILSLNIDEDDDGNAASGRPNQPAPVKKETPDELITEGQIRLIEQLITKHREDGSQYASIKEFEAEAKITVRNLTKLQGQELIDKLLTRIKEIDSKREEAF